ncbi:MAG: hypothetical protein ACRD28_10880 [Acidobacteriaceae bacterium]
MMVFPLPVHGQEKAARRQSNSHNAQQVHQLSPQASPPDPRDASRKQPTSDTEKNASKDKTEDYLYELFSANNLPNVALVIVGIVAICFAWKTVKAAQESADAALLNANALINAERGRLFVSHTCSNDLIFEAKVMNYGRSPVRMKYGFVGCEILDKGKELPRVPNYVGDEIEENAWIFEQRDWVLPRKDTRVGSYAADFVYDADNVDLRKKVLSGEYVVWFYGIARYVDSISGKEHQVGFCYRCFRSGGGWFLISAGPDIYNLET